MKLRLPTFFRSPKRKRNNVSVHSSPEALEPRLVFTVTSGIDGITTQQAVEAHACITDTNQDTAAENSDRAIEEINISAADTSFEQPPCTNWPVLAEDAVDAMFANTTTAEIKVLMQDMQIAATNNDTQPETVSTEGQQSYIDFFAQFEQSTVTVMNTTTIIDAKPKADTTPLGEPGEPKDDKPAVGTQADEEATQTERKPIRKMRRFNRETKKWEQIDARTNQDTGVQGDNKTSDNPTTTLKSSSLGNGRFKRLIPKKR